MTRRGFTMIEMFIVIAVLGILASLVVVMAAQYKARALRATMLTDLKHLVSAQEAFYTQNRDYAGEVTVGEEVPGPGGSGKATFRPSGGNELSLIYRGTDGWTAIMTNPSLTLSPTTCGVFIGPVSYSPNSSVLGEGVPGCW